MGHRTLEKMQGPRKSQVRSRLEKKKSILQIWETTIKWVSLLPLPYIAVYLVSENNAAFPLQRTLIPVIQFVIRVLRL